MKSEVVQRRNDGDCEVMTRLLIIVEGQTEEDFVGRLLAPHLYGYGYLAVNSRLMGKQRARRRRGGIRPWPEARRDIINHLRADPGIIVSTFVDYYGLPSDRLGGWSGRAEAGHLPPPAKGDHVERAMLADVVNEMGQGFNPDRFLPYVMMHEFEAMLFSDRQAFARAIDHVELAEPFQKVMDSFDTPEEINDSPETAPSKRISTLLPGYQKPLLGVVAATAIGLPVIREECPHFGNWLSGLESPALRHA